MDAIIQIWNKETFSWREDVIPWLSENYQYFLVPAILYPFVVQFTYTKRNRGWIVPMFAWNAFQCFYSAMTFVNILPHFYGHLIQYGYHESICLANKQASFYEQPYGKWIFFFMLSKIMDLGDTFFLMARGRKVPLIHWYHHLTTLIAAFSHSMLMIEVLEWYSIINIFIHTWMYGHYAISSVFPQVRGNKALTAVQLAQLVHNTGVGIYHGIYCNSVTDVAGITLCLAYIFLFGTFYRQKYHMEKTD